MSSQASPNPNADDNADAGRAPDRDADRLIEQRPGGAVVGGRYELLEPIGEGGMARVYRARDRVLDRVVAVKLLREEYGSDPDFVARFQREARAAAALAHPNIVDIYDYGPHAGTYFITMQYIEGPNLKQVLRRDAPLPHRRAIAVVDQVLRALAAAHARNIIHRDVKPQNVLVRADDGAIKLADFGVARALDGSDLTTSGSTLGTAHYMAPEQGTGGPIGPATDLYATGIVLYELLTGQLPFRGTNQMQIMLQHLHAPPPPIGEHVAGVPPALEQVVQRALAKDPARRYRSADEMREALTAARNGAAPTRLAAGPAAARTRLLTPAPPSRPAPPPAGDRRALLLLPALLGVLLFCGVLGLFGLNRAFNSRTAPPAEPTIAAVAPPPTEPPATATLEPPTPAATVGAAAVAPAATPTTPPPTATSAPPTPTDLPPTATSVPPTPTRVPPTATPTEEPPTPTRPAPTATPTPRLPTATPIATPTTRPPTATPTTRPPTPTPTRAAAPLATEGFSPALLRGAYRRDDGTLYGRQAAALYGAGTGYNEGSFSFQVETIPDGPIFLVLIGIDDERAQRCTLEVVINGQTVFSGANTLPNAPADDNGVGGQSRVWGTMRIPVPAAVLEEGVNTMTLRNATPGSELGIPYILINDLDFVAGP